MPRLLRPLFLERPASAVLLRKSEEAEEDLLERLIGVILVGVLAVFKGRRALMVVEVFFACWPFALLLLVDLFRCCFAKIGTASSVILKANRARIILKSFFCLPVNMIRILSFVILLRIGGASAQLSLLKPCSTY